MIDEIMTTAEVAAYLKMDEETLRAWRAKSFGPRSFKLGGSQQSPVRYYRSEVDAFLGSRTDNGPNS